MITGSARVLLASASLGALRQMLRASRHSIHVHGKCACDGLQPALLHRPQRLHPVPRQQPFRRQRRQRWCAKVVMPCRCSRRNSRKLIRATEGAGAGCGTALRLLERVLRRQMLLQRRPQRRWQHRSHRRRLWRRRRRQHALPTLVLRLWRVHQGFKIRLLCRLPRLSQRRRHQGWRQPPRLTRRGQPWQLRRLMLPMTTSRWRWLRLWPRSSLFPR